VLAQVSQELDLSQDALGVDEVQKHFGDALDGDLATRDLASKQQRGGVAQRSGQQQQLRKESVTSSHAPGRQPPPRGHTRHGRWASGSCTAHPLRTLRSRARTGSGRGAMGATTRSEGARKAGNNRMRKKRQPTGRGAAWSWQSQTSGVTPCGSLDEKREQGRRRLTWTQTCCSAMGSERGTGGFRGKKRNKRSNSQKRQRARAAVRGEAGVECSARAAVPLYNCHKRKEGTAATSGRRQRQRNRASTARSHLRKGMGCPNRSEMKW
jgi:hypothetical protein